MGEAFQLIEAGYVDAVDISDTEERGYIIRDLTFDGHQLLHKMQNDTVWGKAKAKAAELGGSVPIWVLEKFLDEGWTQVVS